MTVANPPHPPAPPPAGKEPGEGVAQGVASAGPAQPPFPPPRPRSNDHRPESDLKLGTFNNNPPGMSLWALWREDLRTHEGHLFSQGFWALALHRFGNWRMGIRPRILRLPFTLLYRILYKHVEWLCGISLNYPVKVGRRVRIWHHGGMILGALEIGDDVHLRQNTTLGVARREDGRWMKPIIQDRADIGAGAVIAGPIVIGHDARIGANAVVLRDVPPHHIAVGVPAVIKPPRSDSSDRRADAAGAVEAEGSRE